MELNEKIFRYCERGMDAAFWAEPVNALTNGAFIIAALAAAILLWSQPRERRGPAEAGLVALVFAMGIGSFLFHTYATLWASYADNLPISAFMLAYLAYVLRRFLGWHWVAVGFGVVAFFAVNRYAAQMPCSGSLATLVKSSRPGQCLNGSFGYVPALVTMAGLAGVLALQRHPAWRHLATGACLLALSLSFRAADMEVCESTVLAGHAIGTHFMWHLLNATLLYVLARAAILHGTRGPAIRRERARLMVDKSRRIGA